MTTKTTKRTAKPRKKAPPKEIYRSEHRCRAHGNATTEEQAREMIGWTVEPEEGAWKDKDYLLRDLDGKKVRTIRNLSNRPFYLSNCFGLKQELLRDKWEYNGEPITISDEGNVINGQHTLVAFILACQELRAFPERWPNVDPKDFVLEKCITYGVQESLRVVHTLDTAKPRTLSDVIYQSGLFEGVNSDDKKRCARSADFAIRLIWSRSDGGKARGAYSLTRTHSESLDFINLHPNLLEAVRFIHDLDKKRYIRDLVQSPGTASGLLYLMGVSGSSPEKYAKSEPKREEALDFRTWAKAEAFWQGLALNDPDMVEVKMALGSLNDPEANVTASKRELIAMLCVAWGVFASGRKLSARNLRLPTRKVGGLTQLRYMPTVGGIDLGEGKSSDRADILEEEEEFTQSEYDEAIRDQTQSGIFDDREEGDPSPEEILERSRRIREEKESRKEEMKERVARRKARNRVG